MTGIGSIVTALQRITRGLEGGEEAIGSALKAEYGELSDLAVIQAHGNWVLHAVFKDDALPYYALGDGIKYAHVMVLHVPKDAVLLVEEPELHMRPSLMRRSPGL